MPGVRIGPGSISPVIKYLIIINAGVFLIQNLVSHSFTLKLGLTPALFFKDFPNYLYQPITYMFLHGGLFHLFFNMFALWMFGTEIEYAWRSKPFLKFYFYCGLGGALLSLIFNSGLSMPIVGASGAIYGGLIAYWLMFPDRYLLIFFMFPMRVRYAIPLFAIINFLAAGGNVAHLAHLGGAIVGLIYLKLDWRLASPLRFFKSLKYNRKAVKLEKKRQKAEEIMKRVDKILDKINEVGIENISREDKDFLEEASQILSRKDK
jgi:membrane associated rhomboid family serine protease